MFHGETHDTFEISLSSHSLKLQWFHLHQFSFFMYFSLTGDQNDDSNQLPPLVPIGVGNGSHATHGEAVFAQQLQNLPDDLLNIAQAGNVITDASGAVYVLPPGSADSPAPSPGSVSATSTASPSTYVYSPGSTTSPHQFHSPQQTSPQQYGPPQEYIPPQANGIDQQQATEMSLESDPLFEIGISNNDQIQAEGTNVKSESSHQRNNPRLAALLSKGVVDVGHE